MDKDKTATVAGAGAGYLLLNSVQWAAVGIQPGETVKVGVALLLIAGGYFAYRRDKADPA